MNKDVLKRILDYTKPYKLHMVLAFLGALIYVLMTLSVPVLVGLTIDQVVDNGLTDFAAILRLLGLIALAVVVAGLFQWLLNISTRKISAYASRDMRQAAFEKINQVPLKYIDSQAHGNLISRLVNDVDQVSEGLLQGFTQLFPGVITIVGTIVVMLLKNPWIALIVIGITPLSIVFAGFIAKRSHRYFRKQVEAQGRLGGYINEMVTGQDVVRAFGYEAESKAKFREIGQEYYDAGLKAVFYSSMANPGTRFVNSIVYDVVCVVGAIMVVLGNLSVGDVSCFLTYANQYTKPFNEITNVLTQIQTAFASGARIFEILDQQSEIDDGADALSPENCHGEVTLEGVDFSYVPEVPLIENFNLKVQPGQRIAIVGPTGCGKTTLINLLMRFYEVDKGNISVDQQPINHIKRQSLRNMYGMVLQETWLKGGTVRDNIAYGRPNASMEEVVAAAKAAYAHGFIKRLPKGYDTLIEAGGSNLSAGQRQLLCIARIMLCQPDILILDEATSSIDTRTEMLIQQAFEKLMKGRTSFVVAHRLSTIQSADVILVMQDGHVIEQGNHESLLAKDGFYAKLYNSQFAIS